MKFILFSLFLAGCSCEVQVSSQPTELVETDASVHIPTWDGKCLGRVGDAGQIRYFFGSTYMCMDMSKKTGKKNYFYFVKVE